MLLLEKQEYHVPEPDAQHAMLPMLLGIIQWTGLVLHRKLSRQ